MDHPYIKAVKSKFTRIRCTHITWQVLEETRLFIDQRLGPNDSTNRGPRRFPTADLGGLIEDIRQKNLGFSHNANAMEPPREYKHPGNSPGQ